MPTYKYALIPSQAAAATAVILLCYSFIFSRWRRNNVRRDITRRRHDRTNTTGVVVIHIVRDRVCMCLPRAAAASFVRPTACRRRLMHGPLGGLFCVDTRIRYTAFLSPCYPGHRCFIRLGGGIRYTITTVVTGYRRSWGLGVRVRPRYRKTAHPVPTYWSLLLGLGRTRTKRKSLVWREPFRTW